jgi:hypothetical protein
MRFGFALSALALLIPTTPVLACDMDGMFGGRFSPFAAFAHRPSSDSAETPTPVDQPVESQTIARSDMDSLPAPKVEPKAEPKKAEAEEAQAARPSKTDQPAS